MRFLKFEAQGNDFIFICDKELREKSLPEIAKKLLERRFGIGADTLVVYNKKGKSLKFFNPDGTQAEVCGNALLCYGLYLKKFENLSGEIRVKTSAGQINLEIQNKINVFFNPSDFRFEEKEFTVEREKVSCYFTKSIGNPHCVLLNPKIPFGIGPIIERHPIFPEGTNVDFLFIKSRKKIKYRVWERGAGETYSCASATISSFCILRKLALIDSYCEFESRGGILIVEEKKGQLLLKGNPCFVFQGEMEL
jgi:diaminopimelate epimerase